MALIVNKGRKQGRSLFNKIKLGVIIKGDERLINGERPEFVIVDEFTKPINKKEPFIHGQCMKTITVDENTELTEKDLKKAIKSLNLNADKCKKCGTKKDWFVVGFNGEYCKCKADKLCKDPRVQQQMKEIEKLSVFRCMPKAICKIE